MKKSDAAITSALNTASQDLNRAANALNVSVQWLKRQKAKKRL